MVSAPGVSGSGRRADRRTSVLGLAVAVVGLAGTGGCAKERAAINRVQADALDKSFFVGPDLQSTADDPEFYKRGTVVDVAYGAHGAREGARRDVVRFAQLDDACQQRVRRPVRDR